MAKHLYYGACKKWDNWLGCIEPLFIFLCSACSLPIFKLEFSFLQRSKTLTFSGITKHPPLIILCEIGIGEGKKKIIKRIKTRPASGNVSGVVSCD